MNANARTPLRLISPADADVSGAERRLTLLGVLKILMLAGLAIVLAIAVSVGAAAMWLQHRAMQQQLLHHRFVGHVSAQASIDDAIWGRRFARTHRLVQR